MTRWAVVPVVVVSTAMAAAPSTRPMSVPEPAAQARAERNIREVYHREYAQTLAADRVTLARKMLEQAAHTQDDPAAHFVLLREARDLAAGAGDAAVAHAAIGRLSEVYSVNPAEMTRAAMASANRIAAAPAALAEISRVCLSAVEHAVLIDDYATATQLVNLAEGAARRARDVSYLSRAQLQARDLTVMAREYDAAKAARVALQQKADDPAANLTVGRFASFIKGDFAQGLPLLARGADAELSSLAQRDLANPIEPAKRLEIGNAWWDLAQRNTGLARKHLNARATHWYRQVRPSLTGLNRSLVDCRLELIDKEMLREMNLCPGIRAELYRGVDFAQLVKTRVDAQIDFDWGEDPPDEGLPKDNFSIRWSGVLHPPQAGRYELIAYANAGTRIWIDGKLVIEGEFVRQRSGVRAPIKLTADVHTIRVEFWDTGGIAKMKLHWTGPGIPKEQPVPASAWWHEAAGVPARP